MRMMLCWDLSAIQRAIWAGVLVLALASSAVASDVSSPIERLDAGLLQAMKMGRSSPFQQRYDLLAPLVDRAVDLDFILQTAIGARWVSLPADQQAALKTTFRRFSVATFVAHFDKYGGERFDMLPASPSPGGGTIVRIRITPGNPGDEADVLGYVMRQTAGGWKAVDVIADGSVSPVVAQQSEIRSLFVRGGVAGLLARLQQKIAELSGGTLH